MENTMKFNRNCWNAKHLETIEDIIGQIVSLGILGKRIRRMRFIGLAFNLQEEAIENRMEKLK